MIGIAGLTLLAGVLWVLFFTPYPFVWLLRSKKEEPRDKGRADLGDIEEGMIIRKGLRYGSSYPNATYDLYYKPNRVAKRVVIWVHGGSFISGSSIGTRNFGPLLVEKDTIFCAINYALAPRHHFPVQLIQIDEFLNALPGLLDMEKLKMPTAVYLGGDSAGANLAATYTCMKTNQTLAKESGIEIQAASKIQGLLLYCGPYDFCEHLSNPKLKKFRTMFKYLGWAYLGRKHWQKRKEKYLASPYHQITEAYPPTYLCDGNKYSFLWQGKKLAEKLKEKHIPVKTRFYEELPHEFQFEYIKYPKEAMQVLEDTITFMEDMERKLLC